MSTTDEYRQQLLDELIECSAGIDRLIVSSRQSGIAINEDHDQELEKLRVQQKDTIRKLQALSGPGSNAWDNIGDGG